MTKPQAPSDRVGNWMQVRGGRAFWPLDPRPEEIDLDTVASALAKICRFGGHTTEFYTVAEHCVRMSYWIEQRYGNKQLALRALIHDAAEAYVGDMVRPLKHNMGTYRAVENKILGMVHYKVGLTFNGHLVPEVKEADNRILLDERERFLEDSPYLWYQDVQGLQPLGIEWASHAWEWRDAAWAWKDRLEELNR